MKRLIIILLIVFMVFLVKSKALFVYKITQISNGTKKTSLRVGFERDRLLNYLKAVPGKLDGLTGNIVSNAFKAYKDISNIDLGPKEKEAIKKILSNTKVLTGKLEGTNISEQIQQLLKNYKQSVGQADYLK